MTSTLDQFDNAKGVAEKAFSQGLDAPGIHRELLAIAYAQSDRENASRQIQWFAGNPEEYLSLADQGAQARLLGRLRLGRDLLQRAADLARRRNLADAAARFLAPDADGDALAGNCETARAARALSDTVLALCGSAALADRAEQRIAQSAKEPPNPVFTNPAKIPLTRAAEEFGLGHTAKSVELLQAMAPYERRYPFSNYLRGLAYLRLRRGTEAVAEFQKILDHPGANWGRFYPVAYVGLARGAALAGDTARAAKGYRDFLALWQDADPDVPILVQVRKEYAALRP